MTETPNKYGYSAAEIFKRREIELTESLFSQGNQILLCLNRENSLLTLAWVTGYNAETGCITYRTYTGPIAVNYLPDLFSEEIFSCPVDAKIFR